MASNIKDAKVVKGSIATLMDAVLLFIITIKDTLPPGTLKSFLKGTKWNEDDLKRLKLII
jgi:hypothetical protein